MESRSKTSDPPHSYHSPDHDWPELHQGQGPPPMATAGGGEGGTPRSEDSTGGELMARTEMVPKLAVVAPQMRKQIGEINSHMSSGLYRQGVRPAPVLKSTSQTGATSPALSKASRDGTGQFRSKQHGFLPSIHKAKPPQSAPAHRQEGEGPSSARQSEGPNSGRQAYQHPSQSRLRVEKAVQEKRKIEEERRSSSTARVAAAAAANQRVASKRKQEKEARSDAKLKAMLSSLQKQRDEINEIAAAKDLRLNVDLRMKELRDQKLKTEDQASQRQSRVKERQETMKQRKLDKEQEQREARKKALSKLVENIHVDSPKRSSRKPKSTVASRSAEATGWSRMVGVPKLNGSSDALHSGTNTISSNSQLYASPKRPPEAPQNSSNTRNKSSSPLATNGQRSQSNSVERLISSSDFAHHEPSSVSRRRSGGKPHPHPPPASDSDAEHAMEILRRAEDLEERSKRSRHLAHMEALDAKRRAYAVMIAHNTTRNSIGPNLASNFVPAEVRLLQAFCRSLISERLSNAKQALVILKHHEREELKAEAATYAQERKLRIEQEGRTAKQTLGEAMVLSLNTNRMLTPVPPPPLEPLSRGDQELYDGQQETDARLFATSVVEAAIRCRAGEFYEQEEARNDQEDEAVDEVNRHHEAKTAATNLMSAQEEREAEDAVLQQLEIVPTPTHPVMVGPSRTQPEPTAPLLKKRKEVAPPTKAVLSRYLPPATNLDPVLPDADEAAGMSIGEQQRLAAAKQQELDDIEAAEAEAEEELPDEELLQEARMGGPKDAQSEPTASKDQLRKEPMRGTLPLAGPEHHLDYAAGAGAGPKEIVARGSRPSQEDLDDTENEDDGGDDVVVEDLDDEAGVGEEEGSADDELGDEEEEELDEEEREEQQRDDGNADTEEGGSEVHDEKACTTVIDEADHNASIHAQQQGAMVEEEEGDIELADPEQASVNVDDEGVVAPTHVIPVVLHRDSRAGSKDGAAEANVARSSHRAQGHSGRESTAYELDEDELLEEIASDQRENDDTEEGEAPAVDGDEEEEDEGEEEGPEGIEQEDNNQEEEEAQAEEEEDGTEPQTQHVVV